MDENKEIEKDETKTENVETQEEAKTENDDIKAIIDEYEAKLLKQKDDYEAKLKTQRETIRQLIKNDGVVVTEDSEESEVDKIVKRINESRNFRYF